MDGQYCRNSLFSFSRTKAKLMCFSISRSRASLWNLIFQAESVEHAFLQRVVLPHHDQHSSDDENQTEHGQDHFLLYNDASAESHPANRR